jgi:MFS family permease
MMPGRPPWSRAVSGSDRSGRPPFPSRAGRTRVHAPAPTPEAVRGSLLRDGAFCRVWLSGGLAGVLRWLELLAVSVFVLQRTGSPFLVALLTFLRMAPLFLFGIPAGALADRYDRRRLLIGGLVALGLASAILAALALTGRIEIWHVALGTFLNGIFWSSELPVRRTMLGEIAGGARLSRAMALESATSNATRMVGPVLGGVLMQTLGLLGVYLIGVAFYAVCTILIVRLAYRSASSGRPVASLTAMLAEGWRYTRSRRLIVGALAVTVIVNLWGFAYITMVPVIGDEVLNLSPALIGALMSTEGLGALIGALLVARRDRPHRYTQIYTGSSLAFLVGVLAFALSRSFPLSLTLILLCGIGIAGFAVMQSTITFLAAPASMRSRVMGLLTVCIGAGPIGTLHVGLLADWLGGANAVALIALEGLIALGLAALVWPELVRPVDLRAAEV